MEQVRYCVMEYVSNDRDADSEEVCWCKEMYRASCVAESRWLETGKWHRVDLNVVNISRSGVECVESDPDLFFAGDVEAKLGGR